MRKDRLKTQIDFYYQNSVGDASRDRRAYHWWKENVWRLSWWP